MRSGNGDIVGSLAGECNVEAKRRWSIDSLLCATRSLVGAPVVIGPLEILAGSVAVWKGNRWWGMVGGVSGSAVAAVGYWWAGRLVG